MQSHEIVRVLRFAEKLSRSVRKLAAQAEALGLGEKSTRRRKAKANGQAALPLTKVKKARKTMQGDIENQGDDFE